MRAAKANQGVRRERESKQAADNLQVGKQNRVGGVRPVPQPRHQYNEGDRAHRGQRPAKRAHHPANCGQLKHRIPQPRLRLQNPTLHLVQPECPNVATSRVPPNALIKQLFIGIWKTSYRPLGQTVPQGLCIFVTRSVPGYSIVLKREVRTCAESGRNEERKTGGKDRRKRRSRR